MISRMAMEDIEQLKEDGIEPTPSEIIRLNAFGLKVERSTNSSELSVMPRVAILGNVVFREPTIGTEIWFRNACNVFNMEDMDTFIQVRAYSLSVACDKLVDVYDIELVKKTVVEFVSNSLSSYTRGQVLNAISYAVNGNNIWDLEQAPVKTTDEKTDTVELPDKDLFYEVGLIRNGLIYKIGTKEELKKHTRSELELLLEYESQMRYGAEVTKNNHNKHLAEYYMVLDEIREAHKHE